MLQSHYNMTAASTTKPIEPPIYVLDIDISDFINCKFGFVTQCILKPKISLFLYTRPHAAWGVDFVLNYFCEQQ